MTRAEDSMRRIMDWRMKLELGEITPEVFAERAEAIVNQYANFLNQQFEELPEKENTNE